MLSDNEYVKLLEKAKLIVRDIDVDLRPHAFNAVLTSLLNVPTADYKGPSPVSNMDDKKLVKLGGLGKGGPMARLEELVRDNFFKEPKSMRHILAELESRSYHYKDTDLTKQLQILVRNKSLRRTSMSNEKGRQVTHWVNW
jgi:hypothetical protein